MSRWAALVVTGRRAGSHAEIASGPEGIVLGRKHGAFQIPEDDQASGKHARLTVAPDGSGVKLEDLKSTNGTFVADRKVRSVMLKNGDRFRIGRTVFEVYQVDSVEQELDRSAPIEPESDEGDIEVPQPIEEVRSYELESHPSHGGATTVARPPASRRATHDDDWHSPPPAPGWSLAVWGTAGAVLAGVVVFLAQREGPDHWAHVPVNWVRTQISARLGTSLMPVYRAPASLTQPGQKTGSEPPLSAREKALNDCENGSGAACLQAATAITQAEPRSERAEALSLSLLLKSCDLGASQGCKVAAVILERQASQGKRERGSTASRAAELRKRACKLGDCPK